MMIFSTVNTKQISLTKQSSTNHHLSIHHAQITFFTLFEEHADYITYLQ